MIAGNDGEARGKSMEKHGKASWKISLHLQIMTNTPDSQRSILVLLGHAEHTTQVHLLFEPATRFNMA